MSARPKDEGGRIKDENHPIRGLLLTVFILLLRRKCSLDSSSFILILMMALLSGCGTTAKREAPRPSDARTAPATKGGGYYLDDGPGENAPAHLENVPDAVPRVEPLHRGALRPYTVMGRNYLPMTALAPYRARGVASWYGRRYHGRQTSSGEIYDMYAMTAAHTTLPIPSYARVTNIASGKSVVVRINDRGPFVDSRLIDLSYTAAHKLGVLAGGSAMVEVETIVPGTPQSVAEVPRASQVVNSAPPAGVVQPAVAPGAAVAAPTPVSDTAERQIPVAADIGGIYLQLAAFGSRDNAEAYAGRLRTEQAWLAAQLQVYTREGLFRVHAGPFASHNDARQAADRISQAMGIKALVLVR